MGQVNPENEIGCVSIPMLARTGSGSPLISMVCSPIVVALRGVAGAINVGLLKQRQACRAWARKTLGLNIPVKDHRPSQQAFAGVWFKTLGFTAK